MYLYAIVDRLPRGWRPPTAGVAGAAVVPRRADAVVVLGSLVDSVPPASPRNLSLHQDVVATLVDAAAVWPFRYGTTVPGTSLGDWPGAHGPLVEAALHSVRGCVEMTVKLLRLDGAPTRPLSVRDRRISRTTATGGDEHEIRSLAETLAELAGVERWRYHPAGAGGNVIASAAFLVPRGDVPGFLGRIAPVASHAGGIAVIPTGPSVPYSFVPDLVPDIGRAPLSRLAGQGLAAARHVG
jgi:gas vesicle protein GvpL/GvpF